MTLAPAPLDDTPDESHDPIPLNGEAPAGTLALDGEGREVHPVETVAAARVLPYQNPRHDRLSYLHDPLRSRRRDKIIPMAILSVCALVLLTLCFFGNVPPDVVLRVVLLRLGWDIAITFAAFIFLASFFIDPMLEKPLIAAVKLVSAATLRFTLWAIVGLHADAVVVDAAGFLLSFLPFALLLAYFFELDFTDTCFSVLMITLLRWLSYFGLWRLL
jgi:hypothetical protein